MFSLLLSSSHLTTFTFSRYQTMSFPSPVTRQKTHLQSEVLVEPESQVIVHCSFYSGPEGNNIRIWPTTYLIVREHLHKSKLVHAEGIPFAPEWKEIQPGVTYNFTLIFTGLPKDCQKFDLVEEISDPHGFLMEGIERNQQDVYTIYF